MKRHGGLFEKILTFENLALAVRKAVRGKKDRESVARFYFSWETEVLALERELRSGTWRPRPYTTFEIFEPKPRRICAAHIRDRVVHHAVCNIVEPLLDRTMIHDTYACRRGKGTHAAVERARRFARKYPFFLKCDIRKYFETVDHEVLKDLLLRKFKDAALLALLFRIIDHPVPGGAPGKGLPIGNLTSQWFANAYLGELDHFLKDRLAVKGYLRYMDDFLLFGTDKPTLHRRLSDIRRFLSDVLGLEIREEITIVAPTFQGIPFLGYRVYPGTVRLKRENRARLGRKVKHLEAAYAAGKIDETRLSDSVRSLAAHTAGADTLRLRRKLFSGLG